MDIMEAVVIHSIVLLSLAKMEEPVLLPTLAIVLELAFKEQLAILL